MPNRGIIAVLVTDRDRFYADAKLTPQKENLPMKTNDGYICVDHPRERFHE